MAEGEILEVIEVKDQWVLVKAIDRDASGFVPIGYVTAHDQVPAILEEKVAEGKGAPASPFVQPIVPFPFTPFPPSSNLLEWTNRAANFG